MRVFLDRLYLFAGYAAGVFLVLIFGIMMFMSLGRQVGLNIPAGDDIASWCMAAMAFLGLAHTFKRGEIIRVGVLIEQVSGRKRWLLEIFALGVSTAFTLYFTWYAAAMTYDSWRFHDMAQGVLSVPLWFPQLGVQRRLDHSGHRAGRRNDPRAQGQQAELREGAAVLARRVRRTHRLRRRRLMHDIGLVNLSLILLGILIVVLSSGVWIAVALGLIGFVAMLLTTSVPIGAVLATTVWSASASWTLAALPLFIWMGEILFRTRLSEEMFRGLSPWLQWLPGRLIHVNVIGCGIFAAVSGSSAATCATIGKIALPELDKRGYDKDISLGSLAGSGTLGLLIPPSIPMVVYAVTANVSVLQVFLGGFLPGFLVMALYSGYIIAWSLLNPSKIPPRDPPMPFRQEA